MLGVAKVTGDVGGGMGAWGCLIMWGSVLGYEEVWGEVCG